MNRLRELRERLGYSQEGIADSIGMKQRTWSDWERVMPEAIMYMTRLAKKYDVSIDYLCGLTDNPRRVDAEPWTAAALTAAEIISGMSAQRQNDALTLLREMREREEAEQRLRDALYAYRLLVGHEAANRVEQLLANGDFDIDQLRGLLETLKQDGRNRGIDALNDTN